MLTFKHILVPTDFSPASERAEAMAVALAGVFDARITLLHVWSVPNTGYAEALSWPIDEMEVAARKELAKAQTRVAKVHAKTEAVLRVGREWKCILDEVKEGGADLVAMGTQGRHGLPRVVLGSVAEKVVRLSPVPVLTLHGEAEGEPQRADRVPANVLPKTILVATDFSAAGELAVDQALALAAKVGAQVHVLHAYELPILGFPDGVVIPDTEIASRILGWAEKELAACVARRKESAVTIFPILEQADPRQAVLTVAKRISADLVVMGTHGRRGVARALIGSTAEAVVRASTVPVLTVHAAG
jgi:nucleotide-binding universal stress UspA family protein